MDAYSRAPLGALLFALSWVLAAAPAGCVQAVDDNSSPGTTVVPDGSPPMSASDASACRPGDVQTYQPGGYHSATASGQGVCDAAAVRGFDDACLGPKATHQTCMAFKADPATAACAHCIDTPDTDTRYGPLVDHGTFLTPNVAGCLELTAPNSLQCPRSLQALSGCELAACAANCPVQDAASRAAYDACAAQADTGGCHSFQAVVAACLPEGGTAGAAAPCLATNFADFYAGVVPLFCSAPQAGGRDAGNPSFDASFDGPFREAGADAASGRDAGKGIDASSDARSGIADAAADGAPDGAAGEAGTGPGTGGETDAGGTGDAALLPDAATGADGGPGWMDSGYGGGDH